MIIKNLELTNIRSHSHSVISFPLGKTLLEGDIGAGKSSVLLAIEFAFFGLGSDSGASLLKLGQDRGEVRMTFDVEGGEYEVTRRLQRKSGRVQQVEGRLRTPNETQDLSPSELKEKILGVLEFNEASDPKAQSWIYRYAVYTPQEEMKYILALAPEQRLQILRRAFRVEDYKTAVTNAEDAVRQTKAEASGYDVISQGVGERKREIEDLQRKEEAYKLALAVQEGRVEELEARVAGAKSDKERVQAKELELQGTKAEKEYYERMKADTANEVEGLSREIASTTSELALVEERLKEARKAEEESRSGKMVGVLRRRERSLEERAKKLVAIKAAIETKLADYESIAASGVCPVCDRPVEAHDFDPRVSSKESELTHVKSELEGVELLQMTAREEVLRAERHQGAKKDLVSRKSEKSRLKGELTKKEAARAKYAKRNLFAERSLRQSEAQLVELAVVVKEREEVIQRVDELETKVRKESEELVLAKERLANVQKDLTRIAIEVVAKEQASKRSKILKEREIWLEEYFVPTAKLIEKSVLATINQDFDSMFKRWFGMLVADPGKEVSVDEDFTPVVTQGGYEQDVKFLSGGERTSVALAYRLALNVLAQRVSVGMKSNLLILDEPTEGFSKEQLGNVREVLDEVGCPQVIVVSHDKELESFADQIFRVDKNGSDSVVGGIHTPVAS